MGGIFIFFGCVFRFIFWLLDLVVVFAGRQLYNLLLLIADANIFGESMIEEFGEKIYAYLGIFMLFKVSFSIITYIVNPDKMTDSKQGMGKIVQKVMIVLVMIIMVPMVFKWAYDLQKVILEENVIGNLILDMDSGKKNDMNDQGGQIMYTIYAAFLTPNKSDHPDIFGSSGACPDIWNTESSEACYNKLKDLGFEDLANQLYYNEDDYDNDKENYKFNLKKNDPHTVVNLNVYWASKDEKFFFDYKPLIATLCAGFVAYLFFLFTVDVAKRSVKLAFLQIISPIPIISYLDPNQDMSGNGTFGKWLKSCKDTYLSLFIRLVAIFFGVFMISKLTNSDGFTSFSGQNTEAIRNNPFVTIFMIIGILQFVKSLPELLKDLFNANIGGFTLDPRKKFGSTPLIGGAMVAGGTLGTNALLAGGRGAFNSARAGFAKLRGNNEKADALMNDARQKMRERMVMANDVARNSISTGGFLGNDKYDDNVHSRRTKIAKDLKNKELEGKNANIELDAMKKRGRDLFEQQRSKVVNGKSKYSVFESSEFANSAKSVDNAKVDMHKAKNELTEIQASYQRGDMDREEYMEKYTEQAKIAGSAEGRVSALEKMHENVRKQYQSDAEKEDALKSYLAYSGNKAVSNSKDAVEKQIESESIMNKKIDSEINIANEFIKETKNDSSMSRKEKKELIRDFKSDINNLNDKR